LMKTGYHWYWTKLFGIHIIFLMDSFINSFVKSWEVFSKINLGRYFWKLDLPVSSSEKKPLVANDLEVAL
jgi:hypothetical protein